MRKWKTEEVFDQFLKPEPEAPGFDGCRVIPSTFPQEALLPLAVERIVLAGMPIVHRDHVFFVDGDGNLCVLPSTTPDVVDGMVAQEHEQRVRQLRSMPYRNYLQTMEWWQKRLEALDRDGFACRLCGATGKLQVHHRRYDNRGDEPLDDLTTLCRGCHESFHQTSGLVRPGASHDEVVPPVL